MSEESEVSEMIIPAVVAGMSVGTEQIVTVTEPLYLPSFEEARPFVHDLGAAYAEIKGAEPDPFTFEIPENQTVLAIGKQSNENFARMGKPKRLAIVGFADSKKDAPYDDPTWEIWGLNDLHNAIPRWTRWFDIHVESNINEDVKLGRSPADRCGIGGLSRLTCPVYMQDRHPAVPGSVKFPLDEILKTFSKLTGAKYFTNSISYMLAFAIYEGMISGRQWDEIRIYGVDMAVGTEYINQRPSCEYWIGIAEGMGIKCYIPVTSDLNKCAFLYGFQDAIQQEFEQKLIAARQSMIDRATQIKNQIDANTAILHQHEGAIGYSQEVMKIWANCATKL